MPPPTNKETKLDFAPYLQRRNNSRCCPLPLQRRKTLNFAPPPAKKKQKQLDFAPPPTNKENKNDFSPQPPNTPPLLNLRKQILHLKIAFKKSQITDANGMLNDIGYRFLRSYLFTLGSCAPVLDIFSKQFRQ